MTRTDMAYRKTAVEGASGFGLLIALYDTLAGNLRRAAEAQRATDIEKRSREMNHACMVIGYLENGLQLSPGGDLTTQLAGFYTSLRSRLMDAQIKQSAEAFEREMTEVLKVREFWQQIDMHDPGSGDRSLAPLDVSGGVGYQPLQTENRYGGWSA